MSMHSTWMSFRSLAQDSSVKNQKLKPGTLKRIASFAIPYKISLSLFLITVVIDALLIVATPLFLRRLIDEGVIPKNSELVTQLALAVGVIALLDALFSMIGRWFYWTLAAIVICFVFPVMIFLWLAIICAFVMGGT